MYNKLITRPLINKIRSQEVNVENLTFALKNCAHKCPFSTFPYAVKNKTSRKSLKDHGCGNCIALSLYIKNLLKKKFDLQSFLIPATIPTSYQKSGFLEISHVALAVPENRQRGYILDPAFYLKKPIVS